ncbi:MAG: pyridoxamine 5'-phosphate oxidase family protein [Phototrophicaceae bacterium]|jgi:general stress protein 26
MSHPFDSKRSRPEGAASYGINPDANEEMLTWDWVTNEIVQSRNYWVSSTRSNGNPHVAPVWGVWHEEALYFGSDPQSQKGKNFAHNPNIVVHLESGDDTVILEGTVSLFNDETALEAVQAKYGVKYSMSPEDSTNPGGGLYRFVPKRALAWKESDYPNTATRWLL